MTPDPYRRDPHTATSILVALTWLALFVAAPASAAQQNDVPVAPYTAVETTKYGVPVRSSGAIDRQHGGQSRISRPLFIMSGQSLEDMVKHIAVDQRTGSSGGIRLDDIRVFDGAGRLLQARGETYVLAARQPPQLALRRYVIAAFAQRTEVLQAKAEELRAGSVTEGTSLPLPAPPASKAPSGDAYTGSITRAACAAALQDAAQLTSLDVNVRSPTQVVLAQAHRRYTELHTRDPGPCSTPSQQSCGNPPCPAPAPGGYLHNFWHRAFG